MDEILVADFMVFHDVVTSTDYDLVVGDEARDVDYFLHENPELKRFAYVWATDFVGYLPMPDGGRHEAWLTADYNAEMIEQIARYPRIRDAALFIGNPGDIIDTPPRSGPAHHPRLDHRQLHLHRLHRHQLVRVRRPRRPARPHGTGLRFRPEFTNVMDGLGRGSC